MSHRHFNVHKVETAPGKPPPCFYLSAGLKPRLKLLLCVCLFHVSLSDDDYCAACRSRCCKSKYPDRNICIIASLYGFYRILSRIFFGLRFIIAC